MLVATPAGHADTLFGHTIVECGMTCTWITSRPRECLYMITAMLIYDYRHDYFDAR